MSYIARGDVVRLVEGIEGPESERGEEREGYVLALLPDGSVLVAFEGAGAEVFLPAELVPLGRRVPVPQPSPRHGGGFGLDSGGF